MNTKDHLQLNHDFGAHNYKPLEIVVSRGSGVWVWDVEGNRYFDMLSAYSAVNFGHSNPRFIKRAKQQLDNVTLTSRAFYNEQIGPFCKELSELSGYQSVLPMNSGAEAVESAIKIARKWAYQKRSIQNDCAEIICFNNNFAGRTTTLLSFSTTEVYRSGFGPFTPGFKIVEFGKIDQLKTAINQNTAAVLLEPIQGEGGVIIPPTGYLAEVYDLCQQNNILMIADEIQTGLYRTGKLFASQHEAIRPDLITLGKSLGGGIVPISVVLADRSVMDVLTPGTHGSTFGGNPLACAIAREVISFIRETALEQQITKLSAYLLRSLESIRPSFVKEIRGRGLMIGLDIDPSYGPANKVCKALLKEGVLCKDTREQTLRFAPALISTIEELDQALNMIEKCFKKVR